MSARGLVAHESEGFRDRGLSGSLVWDPRPETERGASLMFRQSMGAAADGGTDALFGRATLAGLSDAGDGDLGNRRQELRMGYGFPAFGGRFTSVPEIAAGVSDGTRDYSLGWRLALRRRDANALDLDFGARRREDAGGAPDDTVGARITARW